MAKDKILTFAVLHFIAFWTLGVDSKVICLHLHGLRDNPSINNTTMDNTVPLDMALNSVDDYFKGCRPEMLKKVNNYFLIQERHNDKVFDQIWTAAEDCYYSRKVPLGKLSKNNYIALQVYVNASTNIYKSFNNATRTQKTSYNTFKYHSLHFFLNPSMEPILVLMCKVPQFDSDSLPQAEESQIITKRFEIASYSVKLKKHIPNLCCEVVYKLKSTKAEQSDLNYQNTVFLHLVKYPLKIILYYLSLSLPQMLDIFNNTLLVCRTKCSKCSDFL
uniref:NAD(P)(+)--arginine ADP-ribosyltransferase n=1 Tax=Esox lucius TaxID=8010 RepID=A0A3P8ZY82_ESOLU